MKNEMLRELHQLQNKVDQIRAKLGFSPPGKATYRAPLNPTDDDIIVIESDGFGGATLLVVEGNYPVDYCTKFERQFPNEEEADGAARNLALAGCVTEAE